MRAGETTSTSRPTVPPSFPSGPGEPPPASDLPADLHWFLDDGRPPGQRDAPARTLALAASLYERHLAGDGAQSRSTLAQRIVTDDLLRREADRDQNVYLGPLFTRVLSRAVPDVIFLPETVAEVEETLRWARENGVPVTLRAAASSALGGSVPCDGGLTLDLSRLDHIDVDAGDNVCVIGAGARLRAVHRRLARHDLALPVYPSNLGATFAGWLAGGGVGLNAFGRRRALDVVRAADVVLPSGRLVRFDSDGRMDVPAEPPHRGHREVAADAAEAWFREQGLEPMTFADVAGSEGVLGTIVQLVLAVGRRPSVGAFLLRFDTVPGAFAAIDWISAEAGRSLPRPANLKLVFGSFVRQQRAVWADEARRGWRRLPSDLSAGAGMPWRRIAGPHELGVSVVQDDGDGAAYVYVDFLGLTAARAFGARLPRAPGAPAALGEESVRFSAERFRPQQNKRLGPGLLAAEVVLPAKNVSSFLREAWHLGHGAGLELDPEVYYVADGEALIIAGYLTDHRTSAFYSDLVLAPALLDLAAGRFGGRPYVLGRWQASFAEERFGPERLARLRRLKETHDPDDLLNRGVVLGMGLRGLPGRAVGAVYRPGVAVARTAWATPGLSTLARGARGLLGRLPGPASGRGEPVGGDRHEPVGGRDAPPDLAADPLERAIGCVNCGECNSACPVYDTSCVRLPQTLTHRGRGARRRRAPRSQHDTPRRALSSLRQLRGGLPGRHPASRRVRAPRRGACGRRTPRLRAPGSRPEHPARVVRLPGRFPRGAPRRLPATRAGLAARRAALSRAARRERGRPCRHLPALRRLCAGLPDEREPRVRRRRRTAHHQRRDELYRLRVVRGGLPGQQAQRRADPARGRATRAGVAGGAGRVRCGRRVTDGGGRRGRHVTRLGSDLQGIETLGTAHHPDGADSRLDDWEQALIHIVEPSSHRLTDDRRTAALVEHLLRRAGIASDEFWSLDRARRARLFLDAYARPSRALPDLEITAFDIDKLLKERFRREPLTVGSAWHHGYWRSYFSHAAITHPANDGLREEFSTAWDIVRKQPAVVFKKARGRSSSSCARCASTCPSWSGRCPSPRAARWRSPTSRPPRPPTRPTTCAPALLSCSRRPSTCDTPSGSGRSRRHTLVRLGPGDVTSLGDREALRALLAAARIVELDGDALWAEGGAEALEGAAAAVRALCPHLLLSVWLRHDGAGFWERLEAAARLDHVALVHVHGGALKSYRLVPRVDAFLKDRLLRARVQLVSAGGDGDTHASAASVYEAVLLGANGGAMTHAAAIALAPELVDVLGGAPGSLVDAALAAASSADLAEMATCTLSCWQHSILDFLSCMGIDDVQKTSGNTMAITMTEDWVRQVDGLPDDAFVTQNQELDRRRVTEEPVPAPVRRRYLVSNMLRELRLDLPLVNAARVLAQRDSSYHLGNSSRALNADFLEVIYRMAAGQAPELDDFFITGDQGPYSLDRVKLKVSRESVAWALERLRRDPAQLDYISLAVPRGFLRPGAVPPGASVSLHAAADRPALARFEADERGGFEMRFDHGHPLTDAVLATPDDQDPLLLRAEVTDGSAHETELTAVGHGAHGAAVLRASADGTVVLKREPRGGLVLAGLGIREPIWHSPVSHASTSLGAASEEFLVARVEGSAGLSMTSSGEGGPLRLSSDDDMKWESLQAASGHFGITGADLRKVRDVEIKINQGAKPGKGGRLSGAKVTPTVSKARNIPVGTDALSPDPKHDIYSIEDMPAEVWLWLLYHNHCGIKITGSTYTKYVAAGMWSNFVVDYLLVDAGMGGSGNYHADSSHVGWPDIFRTILHTHHALLNEKVDLDGSWRAALHPRPERGALRRPRRDAAVRVRRPARRARHAEGAHRRRRRAARGQHRQGGGLRLHPVRQLSPGLPARRHHHQAGAHGPERPRTHEGALPQLGRVEPR